MKKFRDGYKAEETHAYHAIREKLLHELRHPRRALDLKAKDLIGYLFFLSLTNQNAWFVTSFCTELTFFCTALNQSEWINFVMYIIRCETMTQNMYPNRCIENKCTSIKLFYISSDIYGT